MNTTEERYFYAWKAEIHKAEERRLKMLKQIQFQLVENHQLKKELDAARELIDELKLCTPSRKQL